MNWENLALFSQNFISQPFHYGFPSHCVVMFAIYNIEHLVCSILKETLIFRFLNEFLLFTLKNFLCYK